MVAIVHEAKAEGYSNIGSVYDLASYLDKEKECSLGFFTHEKEQISPSEVILSIDQNHTKLGKYDPKFFMLTINPSHEELCSVIGRFVNSRTELTDEERTKIEEHLRSLTKKAMDAYAYQFQRPNIHSADDLLYYARIEAKRIYKPTYDNLDVGVPIGREKEGLNYHVHIIVSRKSKDGRVKLSPTTVSKGNEWHLDQRGFVRRGFCREEWTREVQLEWYRMLGRHTEARVIQRKEDSISNSGNEDLKELAEYKFSKASFVLEEMKERGYDVRYSGKDILISRGREQFIISARDLRGRETRFIPIERLKAWYGVDKGSGYEVKSFMFEVKDKESKEKKTIEQRYIRSKEKRVLLGYKECSFEASKNFTKEEVIANLPEGEIKQILKKTEVFSVSERIYQLEKYGYTHRFDRVHVFTKGETILRIPHSDLDRLSRVSSSTIKEIAKRLKDKEIYTLAGQKVYEKNDLSIEQRSYKTKQGEERKFYVVRDKRTDSVVRLRDVIKRTTERTSSSRSHSLDIGATSGVSSMAQSQLMRHTILREFASPLQALNTARSVHNFATSLAGDPATAVTRKLLSQVKQILFASLKQI